MGGKWTTYRKMAQDTIDIGSKKAGLEQVSSNTKNLHIHGYHENSKEFGDYVIHYNAFRSDTISPEVAKQYGLTRANNRVLINIAVLKKVMNTTGKPTSSKVSGHASNLTGQLKNLEFKEITEGTAIYYVLIFVNRRYFIEKLFSEFGANFIKFIYLIPSEVRLSSHLVYYSNCRQRNCSNHC